MSCLDERRDEGGWRLGHAVQLRLPHRPVIAVDEVGRIQQLGRASELRATDE